MEGFKLYKPKDSNKLKNLFRSVVALTYESFLSDSGKLSGGIFYKILRPIIFALIIATAFTLLRIQNFLLETFLSFYIIFSIFFIFLEFATRSAFLNGKLNLLNLPRVNQFTLILSEILAMVFISLSQILLGLTVAILFLPEIDLFLLASGFILSILLGIAYFMIFSLLLYKNHTFVQIHDFFCRGLLFISAVFYPLSIIPNSLHFIFLWNPAVHLMEYSRNVINSGGPHFFDMNYLIMFIITLIFFFPALYLIKIFYISERVRW